MKISPVVIALAGYLATSQAFAQSDPCSDSMTQSSMNQCSYQMWQHADGDLNADYKRARAYLKVLDADLPEDFQGGAKALLLSQRAWITYRDQSCIAESAMHAGGSIRPVFELGCKERLTRMRSEDLRLIFEEN